MIKLIRFLQSPKGTFGVLTIDKVPLCVTLEDPWNNNKKGESCIPIGTYKCAPHSGSNFKNVWELKNVPGRSAILIHQGNTIGDTSGCILVGKGFTSIGGNPAISDSVMTLQLLRQKLPQSFELEIVDRT